MKKKCRSVYQKWNHKEWFFVAGLFIKYKEKNKDKSFTEILGSFCSENNIFNVNLLIQYINEREEYKAKEYLIQNRKIKPGQSFFMF